MNKLHNDLVELNKDVKMINNNFEKKHRVFDNSHVTEVLEKLKWTIDTSQSQINDFQTLLKTQSLCVHTCECQSSCLTKDKARLNEAEKQVLALEQVSLLCQMKTSFISDLQGQLQVFQSFCHLLFVHLLVLSENQIILSA